MELDNAFGRMVKDRRMELGLSQAELAGRVGCATITIRKIEAGDLHPSLQVIERLAMALNIPLEERAAFIRLGRASGLRTPEPPPTPTPPLNVDEIGAEDLSGRAVHGYQLGERIGTGGFGVVYRAVQPVVEREVAIKIILPQYANQPEFIRRFEAEARLVARLEHPHITPLYDYWREPDAAYLVMRLLRGGSLRELLLDGPLESGPFLRMLDQIGAALYAAHRFGVIHRDLKPANILLDEDHNAYLADFGIAKNLADPNISSQTRTGAMLGSPAYASPEQIRSEEVRPQSDIYCLGVLMYEMLSGRQPYQGQTPIDMIMSHLNTPLPRLSESNPSTPPGVEAVLLKATAKQADARYPDVPALLADVHAALGGSAELGEVQGLLEIGELGELHNPYKGLRAFGEADADDFFGRELLVRDLLGRMGEGSDLGGFLAVVGPSGSGKSSVVRAGLAPALRRGGLPDSENWFITSMTPGAHPLEQLEAALLRVAINPPASLLSQLKEDNRGLLRAVRRILPDDGKTELVLIIDQFEELFTLVDDEAARASFLESLVAAVLEPQSRLRVVITLRADFTDRPLQYVDFGEIMRPRMEFVLPLTPDELELAISGPARRTGLVLEAGLTQRIIREVGDQPGTLPLLQYALTELYNRRLGRRLTLDAYRETGGVTGALASRAEQIYTGLGEKERSAARQIFLRLVTLGEGSEDTRRRALRAEVEALSDPAGKERAAFERVIEQYGSYRLLTFDHDPLTRGPTLEVAHEALLREWPRLRGWLDESRADLRLQRALAAGAAEWQAGGHEPSFLLRGARLEQFAAWSRETSLALTSGEQAYLQAGLEQQEHERQIEAERQQREARLKRARTYLGRALVAVLVAGLLIAAGLSVYAFSQRQEAPAQRQEAVVQKQEAETQRTAAQKQAVILLASQAEAELQNGYYDRAVLLGLEALENYPYVPQAERALGRAVSYNRALQQCSDFTSAATSVAWSPDGTRLAATSVNSQVRVLDPQTCQETLLIDLPKIPSEVVETAFDFGLAIRWSPDGKHLLVLFGDRYIAATQDYDLLTYDASSGKQLAAVKIANQARSELGDVTLSDTRWPGSAGLDFAPRSERLASLGGDNTALVWDTDLQKPELVLTGHENDVNSVAWSPDGKQLVTSSLDGTARTWDAQTANTLLVLKGHEGRVNASIWSPDGKRLATAGEDGKACIWDASDGKLQRCIETGGGAVWTLAWAADNERLVTGNDDGAIRIWQVETGEMLVTLRGHDAMVRHLAFAPDGDRLASAGHDGLVRIWNTAPSTAWLPLPYPFQTGYFDFTHDGRYLALSVGDQPNGTTSSAIPLWDMQTRQPAVENIIPSYGDFYAWAIQLSPDDRRLLAFGATGNGADGWKDQANAYIFDVQSGKLLQKFSPYGVESVADWYHAVAWSPDGSQVALGRYRGDAFIHDSRSGQQLAHLQILNLEQKKALYTDVSYLEWSPDGSKLAAASCDSEVSIWDARTWELLSRLVGHEPPTCVISVHWSPDGSRLLTTSGMDELGARDKTGRIWDADTGKQLLVLRGHTGHIFTSGWSPDGRRVVTGSSDGTARVWDAASGDEVLSFSMPSSYFNFVFWSPDGQHLANNNQMSPPVVWRVWQTKEELLADAHKLVFRELTPAERQQYGLPPGEATPGEPAPTPQATPASQAPEQEKPSGALAGAFALALCLAAGLVVARQRRPQI